MKTAFGTFGTVLLVGFIVAFITGVFIMWLWNWLMPCIFGLQAISYWQGVGLSLLSGFLFRNISSSSKDS